MAKSTITVNKKRRGRPALYTGGDGKGALLIGIRLPPDELDAIDSWISMQKETLSRPEAIRRLIKVALAREERRAVARLSSADQAAMVEAAISAPATKPKPHIARRRKGE